MHTYLVTSGFFNSMGENCLAKGGGKEAEKFFRKIINEPEYVNE